MSKGQKIFIDDNTNVHELQKQGVRKSTSYRAIKNGYYYIDTGRGGFREGSGRPNITGPTITVKIPQDLKERVDKFRKGKFVVHGNKNVNMPFGYALSLFLEEIAVSSNNAETERLKKEIEVLNNLLAKRTRELKDQSFLQDSQTWREEAKLAKEENERLNLQIKQLREEHQQEIAQIFEQFHTRLENAEETWKKQQYTEERREIERLTKVYSDLHARFVNLQQQKDKPVDRKPAIIDGKWEEVKNVIQEMEHKRSGKTTRDWTWYLRLKEKIIG